MPHRHRRAPIPGRPFALGKRIRWALFSFAAVVALLLSGTVTASNADGIPVANIGDRPGASAPRAATANQASTAAVVLYVIPHQDDETLSMGSSIRRHLEAGHDVHLLLLTDGAHSGAQPATGLDDAAFSLARDDEFLRAARALGVRWQNIHLPANRAEGGTLTPEYAADLIRAFVTDHPGTWLKGYTDLPAPGRHSDHAAAGVAAHQLLDTAEVANLRLYVEPWLRAEFGTANPGVTVSPERASAVGRVQRAMDEYGDVDRVGGKYGIGYLSVGGTFKALRPDPVNYYHLPQG